LKKNDLKSLVKQMYNDLLTTIESQEQPNKDEIIHYLEDAVLTIQSLNPDRLDSAEHTKLAFRDAHEEIAKSSIAAYKSTNKRFEEITSMQEKTLHESAFIDTDNIKDKFENIQTFMAQEVQKANDIIAELTEKVSKLEKTSNLDGLTQVFNRRALDHFISNLCKKKNLQHDLHLLLLDIDNFKSINDKYGHITGDKILIFISNILKKTLRDGDKLFRYGGEEFIIILNRIDTQTAKLVARRILNLISNNQLIYKGNTLKVTMSIGLTKYVTGDTPDEFITRADNALYESKHKGKNQFNVELFNGV